MNAKTHASELIDAYVAEVAIRLPRRQRNDVAFELRALIDEELQAKAEAAGRPVDAETTLAFLRAFGRPADVAARYRPTLTVIDPAEGRSFVFASAIGLAVIWSLGLLSQWRDGTAHGLDALTMISRWWLGVALPSLWWPGMLVVGFAASAWWRRRWPQTSTWTPRTADRIVGGRAAVAAGLVGILCGLAILLEPTRVLDIVWGDQAAPAARTALTYTESFLDRQALILLTLLALNIPLLIAAMAIGRWTPRLRRFETAMTLLTCATMVWTIADGPIFLATASDRTAKTLMALIVASVLLYLAIRAYRRIKPNPAVRPRPSH